MHMQRGAVTNADAVAVTLENEAGAGQPSSTPLFAVPMRSFFWRTPTAALRSAFTPTSVTTTRAPTWRPMTLMAAPPAAMLNTIAGVTSAGNALTPSAVTPWSAAITAMALLSITGWALPWIPASWMESVSRRPSALGGLVSCS